MPVGFLLFAMHLVLCLLLDLLALNIFHAEVAGLKLLIVIHAVNIIFLISIHSLFRFYSNES